MIKVDISDLVVEENGLVSSPFFHDGVLMGVVFEDKACSICNIYFRDFKGFLYEIKAAPIDDLLMDGFKVGSSVSCVFQFSSENPLASEALERLGFKKNGELVPRAINKSILIMECHDDCVLMVLFPRERMNPRANQ